MSENNEFKQWAILELMGHRRLGGLVTEALIAGSPFIRIDIHVDVTVTTQFYSPQSCYSIIPVGEKEARDVAKYHFQEPVSRWEMPKLEAPEESESMGAD